MFSWSTDSSDFQYAFLGFRTRDQPKRQVQQMPSPKINWVSRTFHEAYSQCDLHNYGFFLLSVLWLKFRYAGDIVSDTKKRKKGNGLLYKMPEYSQRRWRNLSLGRSHPDLEADPGPTSAWRGLEDGETSGTESEASETEGVAATKAWIVLHFLQSTLATSGSAYLLTSINSWFLFFLKIL